MIEVDFIDIKQEQKDKTCSMQRQSIDQSAVPVLQGVWCPSSASWSEENRETTIKFMAA